jgi:hypothetical protein
MRRGPHAAQVRSHSERGDSGRTPHPAREIPAVRLTDLAELARRRCSASHWRFVPLVGEAHTRLGTAASRGESVIDADPASLHASADALPAAESGREGHSPPGCVERDQDQHDCDRADVEAGTCPIVYIASHDRVRARALRGQQRHHHREAQRY